MALSIRYQSQAGSSLGYFVERMSDGTYLDFNDSTFKVNPTALIATLPEDSGSFAGRYRVNLTSTPASQFTDGDYVVTIHNTATANSVVGQLGVVMHAGSDATVIPASGSGSDPWAVTLPGSYPAGTAGAILGGNLDVKVSTRSVFARGPVAGVTTPVTVGTNNDKAGYVLAASGLDAGTGTVVIKGGNTAVTRILASTDNAGNRTAVTLTLPA